MSAGRTTIKEARWVWRRIGWPLIISNTCIEQMIIRRCRAGDRNQQSTGDQECMQFHVLTPLVILSSVLLRLVSRGIPRIISQQ
jgi:hypothetical protein